MRSFTFSVFLAAVFSLSIFAQSEALGLPLLPKAFPYRQGWLGGDVGTSLTLPDGRTLWIFGDTFVDKLGRTPDGGGSRRTSAFIHNSIGISEVREGQFEIAYFWAHDKKTDGAKSFFFSELEGTGGSEYRWPLSLFFSRDQVFVVLSRVRATKDSVLGFEAFGVDIARIANWRDKPEQWRIERIPLSDNPGIFPSAAAVVDKSWVYFFADVNLPETGEINALARVSLGELYREDLRLSLNYLKNDGRYSPLTSTKDLKSVLAQGNSELSVFKEKNQWHLVQTIKNRVLQLMVLKQNPAMKITPLADQIVIQSADQLDGPWSAPQTIYTPPETISTSPRFNPDAFSYAAKVHPDFEKPEGLPFSITYMTNTLDPQKVLDNFDLYRPQAP